MPLSMREYLERGPATSKEIQAQTGLSQTSVARQLRGMGTSVIKLQSGRSLRYALARSAFGGNDKLPLSIVNAHGNTVLAAHIRPLAQKGFFVELATGMSPLLLGEGKNGLYDDLPYFLFDLSPQGFLGRQIAEEMASRDNDFPTDPRRWSANHIGRYLVSNGDDLPGNFTFGEQVLLRLRRKPVPTSVNDYPALADNVMRGAIPGSSAGGEQPKFTAFCDDHCAHVIVKFSPRGDNDVARRWRDILITEYHATKVIQAAGKIPAAKTRLIEREGRLFLESQRFDRAGEYGRLSMISMQAIDAEFTGTGGNWPQVMHALHKKDLVSWQHVLDAEYLWHFGRLINNTDMHLGNISLAIEGSIFSLLPSYDMCSMGFAPKGGGEVCPYAFVPPEIKGIYTRNDVIPGIKEAAHIFWKRVASDERISAEFKDFLDRDTPVGLL